MKKEEEEAEERGSQRMSLSNVISNYIKPIREWYSEINSATLTGAIDVIVVEQPDGSYLSSPFHVRFGKLGVMKAREKIVDIEVNDEPVDIRMKLDDSGVAFFVEGVLVEEEGDELPPELATSPFPDVPSPPPSWTEPAGIAAVEVEASVSAKPPLPPAAQHQGEKAAAGAPSHNGKVGGGRKKRKRRAFAKHLRGEPKESADVEAKEDGSSDDIFDMDDVVQAKEKKGKAPAKTVEGGSLPKLDHKLPWSKGESPFMMSTSVPSSPVAAGHVVSNTRQDLAPPDPPSTKGMNYSSSCSNIHDTEVSSWQPAAAAADDSFLLSRLPHREKLDKMLRNEEKAAKEPNASAASTTMQYFSEPEMSASASPVGSRPGTPVMSDTELEARRKDENEGQPAEQSWEWGKLPTPSPITHEKRKPGQEDEQGQGESSKEADSGNRGWGFSYLWRGRKKNESNKDIQLEPSNSSQGNQALPPEPVYLQDLENDEEMLKIYVGSHLHGSVCPASRPVTIVEEDAESGNGPSLPVSPRSVEVGRVLKYDHDWRSTIPWEKVDVSLCGGLDDSPQDFSGQLFEQGKLSFDDFTERLKSKEAKLFDDPNLVVRLGDRYYSWASACPIIMSHVMYGCPLPGDLLGGSFQDPKASISAESSAPHAHEPIQRKSSWWPFGPKQVEDVEQCANTVAKTEESSGDNNKYGSEEIDLEAAEEKHDLSDHLPNSATEAEEEVLAEDEEPSSAKYRKTMRLTNEAIKKLSLRPGCNEVLFSVTTAFQGTTRCNCHLYLWKWTDKIVISDIDGTITKSDVLGHVLPIIGRDWAQSGVTSLFTKIKQNGYHLAYLSARAIGQASVTKDYLNSVTQGDVNLPDGPLLLNPTSLVNAFHREIIIKKPEEFKIACLRDIQKLFPDCLSEDGNPFYAGYGNRVNDVWAYRAVGIPYSRIFTINSKGELRHDLTRTFQTSYSNLGTICDHVFPPREASKKVYVASTYSSVNYWKEPLPLINIENELKEHLTDG